MSGDLLKDVLPHLMSHGFVAKYDEIGDFAITLDDRGQLWKIRCDGKKHQWSPSKSDFTSDWLELPYWFTDEMDFMAPFENIKVEII